MANYMNSLYALHKMKMQPYEQQQEAANMAADFAIKEQGRQEQMAAKEASLGLDPETNNPEIQRWIEMGLAEDAKAQEAQRAKLAREDYLNQLGQTHKMDMAEFKAGNVAEGRRENITSQMDLMLGAGKQREIAAENRRIWLTEQNRRDRKAAGERATTMASRPTAAGLKTREDINYEHARKQLDTVLDIQKTHNVVMSREQRKAWEAQVKKMYIEVERLRPGSGDEALLTRGVDPSTITGLTEEGIPTSIARPPEQGGQTMSTQPDVDEFGISLKPRSRR